MALIGYGTYDNSSNKSRDAEIFPEYWETVFPNGAIEYRESDITKARAELRIDERGHWWARYMSAGDARISEVHDDENTAREKYEEMAAWLSD